MPVYEYQCKACGHEFEREQRISDKPVKKCPACGAQKAKRLISRTSFVLKGGGWYSDLYSTPGAKKEAPDTGDAPKSDGASEGGAAGGGDASKDAAPEKAKAKGKGKPGKSSGGSKAAAA